MTMTLELIDVSHHQGTINWAQVAKVVDGVIIRCALRGYGSAGTLQTDTQWTNNIKGAIAAGIPRIGIYFFGQAINATEGKEEAEYVLKLLAPYKLNINFPVYYDTEKTSIYPNGRADKISKANRTAAVKAFCERIKAAGYVPGVYASLSYYDEGLNKSELSCYTWWVAAYRNERPDVAKDAWQYSSTGSCAGITGDVDRDYWYTDFATPADGWYKTDGKWYWYEGGQMVKSAWRQIKGYWYYLGSDGAMLTGTQKIGGKVYHLHEKAAYGLPEGACVITDENGVVKI